MLNVIKQCHSFIVTLSVVKLNVIMLSVFCAEYHIFIVVLSVVLMNFVTLSAIMPSVVMLSVIMSSVAFLIVVPNVFSEFRYAECHYTEYH